MPHFLKSKVCLRCSFTSFASPMVVDIFVPESKSCLRKNTVLMLIKIQSWLHQPKVWRFMCFSSSIVGLVCYSFQLRFQSFNWKLELVEDLSLHSFQFLNLHFHLVCKDMGVLQFSLFGSSQCFQLCWSSVLLFP